MKKISVIIPTIRDTSINEKCLARQTFTDFEVIIQRPEGNKPEGLLYTLNRDLNKALKKAKGELIISYQDLIEIKPDCLERFWFHYTNNPNACVGAVGDQYSSLDPPIKVWTDPRKRMDFGSFYELNPIDIEFTLCAVPRQAFFDVGGFDEEFDKYAALSEKELMYRIDKLGYKSYIDQTIEYRALKHERLSKDWDQRYFAGFPYYEKCLKEVREGKRLKLDYLS